MKNEISISPETLNKFAHSVKTVFSEKLEEGFHLEINAYTQFLDSFNRAFADYRSAFSDFKTDKLSIKFLSASLLLHKQIKEALELCFDKNQPLYLEGAFQDSYELSLALFSELGRTEESEFYSYIQTTEERQFNSKPYLLREMKKMWKKLFRTANTEEASIHSFLYFYYQQTAVFVLEENKETFFGFYRQLALFLQDSWTSFENNTAFINQLHRVDYNAEALAPGQLIWDLDNQPERKLIEIKQQFRDFCDEVTSGLNDKLINFDFARFSDQKKKHIALDEIKAKIHKDCQAAEKSNILWRTTRFAFTEDMGLDIEIYLFKYQIAQRKLLFIRAIDSIFNKPFYEGIDKFESQFDSILDDLTKSFPQVLKQTPEEALRKLRLQVKKELFVKALRQIHQRVNSSGIIKEIDDFETMAQNNFVLSPSRMLMKKPDYTRKVKPDELESILPNDLVSFEIKPDFIKVFPAFKRAVIEHIQTVLNEIETAPQIFLFSIESAGQYFKENQNTDEVPTICIEGLKRSKTKLQETSRKNSEFFEKEIEKLRIVIEKLVDSVTEITNNESAFQIKMRVMRAKALTRSKVFKDKVLSTIMGLLPRLFSSFKTLQKFGKDSVRRFSDYFALETPKGFIDTDISDHLSTTHLSIEKLPYIYQRLFSFEPLETFELYIERKPSMDKMELAFSRWKEEKFAPVVIIGEKGSGKTTFINRFLKTTGKKESVIQLDLLAINKNPADLYKHILETTQLEKPLSGEKKIVVLDGFERLYEARINGFEYLLKLFKIISDTQKDIFWVVAVHSVSWAVFDKSIEAANYFGYHIYMNELEFNELNKLIESRHKLSGYSLVFVEKQKKKSILSGKTTDWEEQQKLLRSAYFNDLNKRVQGNILQTFIYWMRSASLLDNKTIQIESEDNLDYSFVRNIAADKLILLKNILIHNGLNVHRLAQILRRETPDIELQVQQLIDDGILRDSEGVLFITPLVYKQLIKHMENINLIH